MSAKRISTMTAAVAAAALSLTACGEGNSTGTSAAASTDRATTSVATGATASGASSSDGTNSAAPGDVDVKVGDTIDAMELGKRTQAALKAAKTAHAEIAGDSSGTMSMDIDMATRDFALSGDSGGENFEIRKVGERLFMGGMPDMPGGKKWLQIGGGSTDDPMSGLMGPLMEMMTKLTDVGSYAVDGMTATATAVDGDQVTWQSTMTAEQIEEMTKKLLEGMDLPSSSGTSPLDAGDVTIRQTLDGQQRPVRVEMVTDTGGKQDIMTMTYSTWGEPVDVTAPPASEVATMSDLMSGLNPSSSTSS